LLLEADELGAPPPVAVVDVQLGSHRKLLSESIWAPRWWWPQPAWFERLLAQLTIFFLPRKEESEMVVAGWGGGVRARWYLHRRGGVV
jgi:hypothetical protein